MTGDAYPAGPPFNYHAFLWSNGTMIDLGTLPGGSYSTPYYQQNTSLNNRGEVVGYADTAASEKHAFLWSKGTMIDLGAPGGFDSSYAVAINDRGQVVGNADRQDGMFRALLWSGGTMTDLGTLPGGESVGAGAQDINNKGQVTGGSATATSFDAFLWSKGTMADLGILPGGSYSFGSFLNESGQVTGNADAADGRQVTFLWSKGTMYDLGTLGGSSSFPRGINARGQVVGDSETASGEIHGFISSFRKIGSTH